MKSIYIFGLVTMAALGCGRSTQDQERETPQGSPEESVDESDFTLSDSDESVSAAVENFHVTVSVGRDGPLAAPCRKADILIVSDAPLKLTNTFWMDGGEDQAAQVNDHTVRLTSRTTNGRDGIVLLVRRGAKLRIQDQTEGQGLSACAGLFGPVSMNHDLSAFTTDQYAPPRTGLYGRHWPFARSQRFFTNRYSIRATFRIGPTTSGSLAVED